MTLTPDQLTTAATHWSEGKSMGEIARLFGISRSSMSGLMNRNRHLFPKKRSVGATEPVEKAKRERRNRETAQNRREDKLKKHIEVIPDEELVKVRTFIRERANDVYDLTAFRIQGAAEPTRFADLTEQQCRFPLEELDARSGPETLCCGEPRHGARWYCLMHHKLMYSPVESRKAG